MMNLEKPVKVASLGPEFEHDRKADPALERNLAMVTGWQTGVEKTDYNFINA